MRAAELTSRRTRKAAPDAAFPPDRGARIRTGDLQSPRLIQRNGGGWFDVTGNGLLAGTFSRRREVLPLFADFGFQAFGPLMGPALKASRNTF
jgi:hypothetical protein